MSYLFTSFLSEIARWTNPVCPVSPRSGQWPSPIATPRGWAKTQFDSFLPTREWIPSWERSTYPFLKALFKKKMFSQGGICDRSLDGMTSSSLLQISKTVSASPLAWPCAALWWVLESLRPCQSIRCPGILFWTFDRSMVHFGLPTLRIFGLTGLAKGDENHQGW